MGEWHYRAKRPGEPNREPIYGEFFSIDAISEPGMALIREAIQNSLDAKRPDEKARVRVYLSGSGAQRKGRPAEWSQVAEFMEGAWEHIRAEGTGLPEDLIPREGDECPWLVIEDFGTTGLEGDPSEPFQPKEKGTNRFYHFFRAEGQTDKGTSDRGSWGVGKHVFLQASRVSVMLGLTVRASDRNRLLMGKNVLKSHYIEDRNYQDGYYGTPPDGGDGLVMPFEDTGVIDRFAEVFRISRGRDEPGLSVVVPWIHEEITEEAILKAIVTDYFYPILTGTLDVIVKTPNIPELEITQESLSEVVGRLDLEIAGDVRPVVDLAIWAQDQGPDARRTLKMPDPGRAWQWSEDLIPDGMGSELRDLYTRGEPLAVRVPVTVVRKNGKEQESFFDVYLRRNERESRERPFFIRDGIVISRVDAPYSRGITAIVVAEDAPISSFLRTAENPSHTEWQTTHLKEEYRYGCVTDLKFVKTSVHELTRLLFSADAEEDPSLLIDIFSLPENPEEEIAAPEDEPTEEPGRKTPEPDPPERRPRRFRIEQIAGGLSVVPGKKASPPVPSLMEVRMAYDVRRGHPLKRYEESDFQVDRQPIEITETRNISVLENEGNRVLIRIEDADFRFGMRGFDERRQLYVKVDLREDTDGDQAA